jgi:hypothetical protein
MKVIVPCGGAKASAPCAARNLYVGSLFKGNLRYALSIAGEDDIRILSAKHGFLTLGEVVAPYELRFGMTGAISVDALRGQAKGLAWDDQDVLVLGGVDYVMVAKQVFPGARSAHQDMRRRVGGTGIGHQLKWLKDMLGRVPDKETPRREAGAH